MAREFVIIFGPPAVGKMSVGQALCVRTGFKLFHNHMSIEPLLGVFAWESLQFQKLVTEFRTRIFEEAAAASDLLGLVFTWVWAFELPSEKECIDKFCAIFGARGVKTSFVELATTLDERLKRNRHPDRLAAKASKRSTERSESMLLEHEKKHRFNSSGAFYYPDRHIYIDNTHLSPDEVAARIIDRFDFKLKAAV